MSACSGRSTLADTDFSLSQEIVGRSARGYLDPADAARHGLPSGADVTASNPAELWAAGGAVSTLADVATFVSAYLGGRLLSPAATAEITGSGIGVVPVTPGGVTAWAKGGEVPGFTCRAIATADGATVAVAMVNLSGDEARARIVELCESAFLAALRA